MSSSTCAEIELGRVIVVGLIMFEKYNKSKSELTLLKRNLESERLLRKRAVQKYKNVSNLNTVVHFSKDFLKQKKISCAQ